MREGNEDAAYAGHHLLAVADGMGGHAHGEVASASAIAALAPLDGALPEAPSEALEAAVHQANDDLRRRVEADPSLEGMGTTLTAMLWTGQQSALAHVGDSRAYLLRDGELYRMTRDHTLVQSLVDEGRLTGEEAAAHPQRSLLLRALDGRSQIEPDLSVRDPHVGDRYLLCSDGLSGVLNDDTLRQMLSSGRDPAHTTEKLVELANEAGGPDNITCVVADLADASEASPGSPAAAAAVAGAAAAPAAQPEDTATLDSSAGGAEALGQSHGADPDHPEAPGQDQRRGGGGRGRRAGPRSRWRRPGVLLSLLLVVVALGATGYGGWSYARSQYYVGAREGEVAIFRGLSQQVAGRDLSRVHTRTGLPVRALPRLERDAVANRIRADSLSDARVIVTRLRAAAWPCSGNGYADDSLPRASAPSPDPAADGNRTTRARPEPPVLPASPSPSARPSPRSCPERVSPGGG